MPWFDYYDTDAKALGGAEPLGKAKSLAWLAKLKGEALIDIDEPVTAKKVIKLGPMGPVPVREAEM